MDVILKVLDGAKQGTKIAVKKDEFLVGRSQDCHLCVGSSSVSRRHCIITRDESKVYIKDLGSRNGTLVNERKIETQTELSSGDELAIGSLKLLLTISHGINNLKKPKVTSVADAVERTVATGDSSVGEEDITKWLLEAPGPSSQMMNETQTIRMDDTNAVHLQQAVERQQAEEAAAAGESPSDESTDDENDGEEKADKKKKKEPGKLPPISKEPASKDSREAAMMALRNWNRRR